MCKRCALRLMDMPDVLKNISPLRLLLMGLSGHHVVCLGTGGEPPTSLFGQFLEACMVKILGWIVGIVFLIGLLVVFGVFDLIF